jgi:hypothetical protein
MGENRQMLTRHGTPGYSGLVEQGRFGEGSGGREEYGVCFERVNEICQLQ